MCYQEHVPESYRATYTHEQTDAKISSVVKWGDTSKEYVTLHL